MNLAAALTFEELTTVTNGEVSFSNKELFDKLDRRFDQLAKKIDDQYIAQNSEIRDVRHRVANLEHGADMRNEMDKRMIAHFDDFRGRMESYEERLTPVEDYVVGRKDVDTYRRWLIATVLVIMGLIITIVAVVGAR